MLLGQRLNSIHNMIGQKLKPTIQLGQKIHDKCGMRASMTAELVFTDVQVSSYIFNTVKSIQIISNLPKTRLEPRTSGVRSNRSTNRATTIT